MLTRALLASLAALLAIGVATAAPPGQVYLQFNGIDGQVEVPDHDALSVNSATGALTVAAWMRPDGVQPAPDSCAAGAVYFERTEDTSGSSGTSRYVHWMGKGVPGEHEWVFRMYSCDNTQGRNNRISFYMFNPTLLDPDTWQPAQGQNEGVGSYYQPGFGQFQNEPPIEPGQWLHIVGVADGERTRLYVNGVFKKCDRYAEGDDPIDPRVCPNHFYNASHPFAGRQIVIRPQNRTAPLRMAHRDRNSFLPGALSEVRIWNRALAATEVEALYASTAPRAGLVAEYLLNEGDGNIVRDTAGAGAPNGTIQGGATWASDPVPGAAASNRSGTSGKTSSGAAAGTRTLVAPAPTTKASSTRP